MNAAEIFRKSALLHSERAAISAGPDTLTHAQVFERGCRLANGLHDMGLKQTDRVAVLAGANLASLEQIGGLALGGFVRVPLNETMGAELQLGMIEWCEARAVILDRRNYDLLHHQLSGVAHIIVQNAPDGVIDYEAFLAAARSDDPRITVRADEPIHISFTSGTTSQPKALVHLHRGVLGTTWEHLLLLPDLGPQDRYLAAMPLQSFPLLVWALMLRGASVCVMPAYDAAALPDMLTRERITVTWLFPTLLERLAETVRFRGLDMGHLRALFSAGGALSGKALRQISDALGDVLYLGYGQAEGNPASMLTPQMIRAGLDGDEAILRSTGQIAAGAAVRILDDAGHDLPPGRLGHIVIDTAGNMKEIWRLPEATAERVRPDGFLRTGDYGHLDERGHLFVAGRFTEMIRHADGLVSPVAVEDAIMAHPAVREVAAYGMPQGAAEAVHVTLCLEHGSTVSAEGIGEWCRENLPPSLCPSGITILEQPLARNPVGKILRADIRAAQVNPN